VTDEGIILRKLYNMRVGKNRFLVNSFLFGTYLFAIMLFCLSCSRENNGTFRSESDPRSKLLPIPQKQSFSGSYFIIGNNWKIVSENENITGSSAIKSLITGLKERAGLEIDLKTADKNNSSYIIRLSVRPGSVKVPVPGVEGGSLLEEQAYRLKLKGSVISIDANGPAGLFYGVQSLLQLINKENGSISLPEGEITDWPDLELRTIYWDCAHHLERPEAFRRAIREAAYYKINGFALKLEGHFQYKCASPIVEPYAMTPEEYQDLTDYAKSYFIELIPYLDAPAHVSFILKHKEYSALRAFPDCNYEFSIADKGTEKLVSSMFDELINASKGGKYILLSTDEAYYSGKSEKEKESAMALGGNGKLLADFIKRMADKLHEKGRTVISWVEYPLTESDIPALPSHLVNGVYNPDWADSFTKNGNRQFIYTSTQGVEPLFPNYFPLSDSSKGRVGGLLKTIYDCNARGNRQIPGVIVAARGDSGLHPETFWLGYATGCAAAWNLTPTTARDLTDRFFLSFYGNGTIDINIVYQLLSKQADFWDKSWELFPLKLRSPILGNSKGIYDTPRPAMDQSLPMLPVPSAKDLSLSKDWSAENSQRLGSAAVLLTENNELLDLLQTGIRINGLHKYNLEVLQSAALLCRQNITMLFHLQQIDKLLKKSSDSAFSDPVAAISFLDQALNIVGIIRSERNETLSSVTALWYQDWYPRVAEANGRKYFDRVDDIKDHLPVRTVDMSYLVYRQIHFPLGRWAENVRVVRNQFAAEYGLPPRTEIINWESTDLAL
jgi:hexosaminidase